MVLDLFEYRADTNTSLNSHYVAFIRKQLQQDKPAWVLFNDEKVVEVVDVEEMKKFAYIYFFNRVGSS